MPNDPKKNVKTAEDFLTTVLIGQVVAAAMTLLGMKLMDDNPNNLFPSLSQSRMSKEHKQEVIIELAHRIVSDFVNLSVRMVKMLESKAEMVFSSTPKSMTLCLFLRLTLIIPFMRRLVRD